MKQILFFILFATLFVACDKNSESSPELTTIRIKERPCEMLEYIGIIGNDFDAALDSLRKLKNISSEIIKEPLEVLFDYDNRQFWGITYGDCGMYSDVLDTKGNHYLRTWYCPDENGMEEESIFKDFRTFTIIDDCGTINYAARIGLDFDSALDSLIKYRYIDLEGKEYEIKKDTMNIYFDFDDRVFISLWFWEKDGLPFLQLIDVLDTKGNYYLIDACDD